MLVAFDAIRSKTMRWASETRGICAISLPSLGDGAFSITLWHILEKN